MTKNFATYIAEQHEDIFARNLIETLINFLEGFTPQQLEQVVESCAVTYAEAALHHKDGFSPQVQRSLQGMFKIIRDGKMLHTSRDAPDQA
jgi:hypothetical protein